MDTDGSLEWGDESARSKPQEMSSKDSINGCNGSYDSSEEELEVENPAHDYEFLINEISAEISHRRKSERSPVRVRVLSPSGRWRMCNVVCFGDKGNGHEDHEVKIHYEDFTAEHDEWIGKDHDSMKRITRWDAGKVVTAFKVGSKVRVLSRKGKWRLCKVVSTQYTQLKIHYEGYKKEHDEWIVKGDERITLERGQIRTETERED